MKLDVPLLVVGAVVGVAAFAAFIDTPAGRVDRAQAAFEAREKPKNYDFDAWRAAGDLKCQDAPTLRICRANPVVSTEYGGMRDFMSFACSATECAWVDP